MSSAKSTKINPFGYYFRLAFTRKGFYLLFNLTVVLQVFFDTLTPYFVAEFITLAESGNTESMRNTLYKIIFAIVGNFIVSELLVSSLAVRLATYVYRLGVREMAHHLQVLDYDFHASRSTGKLMAQISSFHTAIITLVYNVNTFFFRGAVWLVLPLFYIAQKSPTISLSIFLVILAILPIYGLLLRINFKARKKVTIALNRLYDVLVDNLIGFESVRVFCKEKRELQMISTKVDDWSNVTVRADVVYRFMIGSVRVAGIIIVILGMLIALRQYNAGTLEVGGLVLVATYILMYPGKLIDAVWNFRDGIKASTEMSNFLSILEQKPMIVDRKDAKKMPTGAGSVEFMNVSFTYDKNVAIDNLSFKINPAEKVAFVGPSGAGKTTITKLLFRYYDPSEGKILIDNTDISSVTLESLRSRIGIVPQDPVMFNNTIAYNVGYAKDDITQEEIEKACEMARISDFINTLPDKYETVVGERGIKLSGGQRQRIAIARTMIKNPQVLVFDEATSQLDSESERLIHVALKEVGKKKTVILIAHRLSTVVDCDRIFVIDNGKIVEVGRHNELLKNRGVYARLWEIQSKGFINGG